MQIIIDSKGCTGCRICEYACSYHHDREFSSIGSSLMLHRNEKKNYYGLVLKREKDLLLARPEGAEILKPGQQIEGAGASSKPILMRGPCDLCEGEEKPFCIQVCPAGCINLVV